MANTNPNSAALTPASNSMAGMFSFVTASVNHLAGRYISDAWRVMCNAVSSVACTRSVRNTSSMMNRSEKQNRINTSVSTVCTRWIFLKPVLIRAIRKPRNAAASIGMTGRKSDGMSHNG